MRAVTSLLEPLLAAKSSSPSSSSSFSALPSDDGIDFHII